MEQVPTTRVLNLTRLLSRACRTLTGVDRVELAYLRRFLTDDTPVFGLIRTSLGWLLLDRDGMQAFEAAVTTGDWGRRGLLSRLSYRLSARRQAALSLVRRHSIRRCRPRGLAGLVAKLGPIDYYSVAHSNLAPAALRPFSREGHRVNVLIHDIIPLELPQMQRAGTVAAFRAKIGATIGFADRIIFNSQDTKDRLDAYVADAKLDAYKRAVVAHLGVDLTPPDAASLPKSLDLTRPYFITVGTIEPRKNHGLLLDVWEALGADAPRLFICGSRGWQNEDVFARLDRGIESVTELSGLSDGAIAALFQGAHAMLFPSFAEGFGLPPIEAAALGTPVICGDLAIWREVLGDTGVYLDVTDRYKWQKAIIKIAEQKNTSPKDKMVAPTWADHFKIVLSMT